MMCTPFCSLQTPLLPESGGVLVYILMADLLNSIIREIIIITVDNGGNKKSAAIAAVIAYIFVLLAVFGSAVVISFIYHCSKRDEHLRIRITSLLIQCSGALLYYFGDNINELLQPYAMEFGCGETCLLNSSIAGMIASGSVLVFYQEIPACMRKVKKLLKYKEKTTLWFATSEMITVFIKLDALYNTVVREAAQIDEFCDPKGIAINVAFIVIFVLVATALMTVNCLYVIKELKELRQRGFNWLVYFTYINGNLLSNLPHIRPPSATGLCL